MWKLRDIQKGFASLTGLPQISAATAGSESLGGQRLTVSAWGFGDRAEGVGKMLGPRCLVTGRQREVVQRGRQEASAPHLLEKCGLSMAMGHAPASPSSLRTDIYPQSFFVRARAEDEVCYQEVSSYCFASCPLWLPVCAKRRGLDTDWPQHVGQATEVLPCLRNSLLDVEITGE